MIPVLPVTFENQLEGLDEAETAGEAAGFLSDLVCLALMPTGERGFPSNGPLHARKAPDTPPTDQFGPPPARSADEPTDERAEGLLARERLMQLMHPEDFRALPIEQVANPDGQPFTVTASHLETWLYVNIGGSDVNAGPFVDSLVRAAGEGRVGRCTERVTETTEPPRGEANFQTDLEVTWIEPIGDLPKGNKVTVSGRLYAQIRRTGAGDQPRWRLTRMTPVDRIKRTEDRWCFELRNRRCVDLGEPDRAVSTLACKVPEEIKVHVPRTVFGVVERTRDYASVEFHSTHSIPGDVGDKVLKDAVYWAVDVAGTSAGHFVRPNTSRLVLHADRQGPIFTTSAKLRPGDYDVASFWMRRPQHLTASSLAIDPFDGFEDARKGDARNPEPTDVYVCMGNAPSRVVVRPEAEGLQVSATPAECIVITASDDEQGRPPGTCAVGLRAAFPRDGTPTGVSAHWLLRGGVVTDFEPEESRRWWITPRRLPDRNSVQPEYHKATAFYPLPDGRSIATGSVRVVAKLGRVPIGVWSGLLAGVPRFERAELAAKVAASMFAVLREESKYDPILLAPSECQPRGDGLARPGEYRYCAVLRPGAGADPNSLQGELVDSSERVVATMSRPRIEPAGLGEALGRWLANELNKEGPPPQVPPPPPMHRLDVRAAPPSVRVEVFAIDGEQSESLGLLPMKLEALTGTRRRYRFVPPEESGFRATEKTLAFEQDGVETITLLKAARSIILDCDAEGAVARVQGWPNPVPARNSNPIEVPWKADTVTFEKRDELGLLVETVNFRDLLPPSGDSNPPDGEIEKWIEDKNASDQADGRQKSGPTPKVDCSGNWRRAIAARNEGPISVSVCVPVGRGPCEPEAVTVEPNGREARLTFGNIYKKGAIVYYRVIGKVVTREPKSFTLPLTNNTLVIEYAAVSLPPSVGPDEPPPPPPEEGIDNRHAWLAGAATLVVAAGGAFYLGREERESADRHADERRYIMITQGKAAPWLTQNIEAELGAARWYNAASGVLLGGALTALVVWYLQGEDGGTPVPTSMESSR